MTTSWRSVGSPELCESLCEAGPASLRPADALSLVRFLHGAPTFALEHEGVTREASVTLYYVNTRACPRGAGFRSFWRFRPSSSCTYDDDAEPEERNNQWTLLGSWQGPGSPEHSVRAFVTACSGKFSHQGSRRLSPWFIHWTTLGDSLPESPRSHGSGGRFWHRFPCAPAGGGVGRGTRLRAHVHFFHSSHPDAKASHGKILAQT